MANASLVRCNGCGTLVKWHDLKVTDKVFTVQVPNPDINSAGHRLRGVDTIGELRMVKVSLCGECRMTQANARLRYVETGKGLAAAWTEAGF